MVLLTKTQSGESLAGSRIPGADRASIELFAAVLNSYLKSSSVVQEIVVSMAAIINDPAAEKEEVDAAIDTLIEALFPAGHDGVYGVDMEMLEAPGEARDAAAVLDSHRRQEEHFTAAVRVLMAKKNMTQHDLAKIIGVSQPAISMLLSRKCRPQKMTVEKIAQALQVAPGELWPEI
jgi:DNA-binding Xre family transcriptional regulator